MKADEAKAKALENKENIEKGETNPEEVAPPVETEVD